MQQPRSQPTEESADRTRRDLFARDLFAWSLLTGLILLAVLGGPFFAGRIYTRDDLGAFHLPTRAFYARQLARGQPFDWMPHLYCGYYLTGEGQAGTYHPLHRLLYGHLPLRAALGLEHLATYPFMLAGTWLFLRRRLRRSDAAMFGAMLFTFCSFNMLHFLHPNAVAVVAHLPWLLWAIDVVLVDRRRRTVAPALAAIALLTGSQLLLGYPQFVWLSLVAEVAYVLFVLAERRHAAGACGRLLIAKLCGLLLGAVQLLPTADALLHSARKSAGTAFADWGSLHPLNLVQLVAPYMFTNRVAGKNTHELGLYAGAVPLMLVVWLLVRRRRLGRMRPLAAGAACFGLFALFMSLGKYGLLYRLQACLPLLGRLRFPCRYLVLVQLSVALLAALGFVLLLRDCRRSRPRAGAPQRRPPWQTFRAPAIVTALSLVAAAVGLALHDRPWMAPIPAILAGPLLIACAAALLALAARGSRRALVGMILFAGLDLGAYGMTYAVYPRTRRLEQYVAEVDTPPPGTAGRVLADLIAFDEEQQQHTGNWITLRDWHRADGYSGIEPRRRLDYGRLDALRIAGVRWVRRGKTTARIEGLIQRDGRWLEVPDPLPRARLVSRTTTGSGPGCDLGRIDVDSTALTEFPLVLLDAPPGTARIVSERPGRLLIECDCPATQLLVVSESFHPGWQAIVDDEPRTVLRVNGDFLGCLVGPGKSRVVLEFRPDSLRRGWIATYAGMALVLVCFVGCGAPRQQLVEDVSP